MCCVLCGVTSDPSRCRYVNTSSIHDDLRNRCGATAFHYAAVMAMPSDGREPVCNHCANWRRFARKGRGWGQYGAQGGRRMTHTPLDR
jgi:hypothetical protein